MFRIVIFISLFLVLNSAAQAVDCSIPFAVVGDTQRTLRVEKALLRRESNEVEQHALIAALAHEKFSFIGFLGDLVSWGSSATEWKYFDLLVAPVLDLGTPKVAILGNHDYMSGALNFAKPDLSGIEKRFPELQKSHWFAFKQCGLGLAWLDSNRDFVTQSAWLAETLAAWDTDPEVRGVLVFAHHPVYTNSEVTGDEANVIRWFLPTFVASTKSLAYISGHAHGYEHFMIGVKHLIVSGGGGGPRVLHLQGKKARHLDLFSGSDPRPFHYLLIDSDSNGVTIRARGFSEKLTEGLVAPMSTFDRIRIDFHPQPQQ